MAAALKQSSETFDPRALNVPSVDNGNRHGQSRGC